MFSPWAPVATAAVVLSKVVADPTVPASLYYYATVQRAGKNQRARCMHSCQNRRKMSHVNLGWFCSKLYFSCNTKVFLTNETNGYCQSLYQDKCSYTKSQPIIAKVVQ